MPLHAPLDDQPPQSPVPVQAGLLGGAYTHQDSVLILDWDDTLLCSSHLAAHSYRLDSSLYDLSRPLNAADSACVRESRDLALQLRELETCVLALLQQASAKVHRTIIVTNAEAGWVQLSAAKFLPRVVPLLEAITIISARSSFESLFPDSPLKWKYYSIHSSLVGHSFFGTDGRVHVDKHVISLGDSHVEREAVRALCKNVPSTRTKTVKFAERPTAEQLRRQLELVVQCFGYITSHAGDLDLQLTVTMNANGTPAAPNSAAPATPTSPAPPHIATDAASDAEVKALTPTGASALKQQQMHHKQEAAYEHESADSAPMVA